MLPKLATLSAAFASQSIALSSPLVAMSVAASPAATRPHATRSTATPSRSPGGATGLGPAFGGGASGSGSSLTALVWVKLSGVLSQADDTEVKALPWRQRGTSRPAGRGATTVARSRAPDHASLKQLTALGFRLAAGAAPYCDEFILVGRALRRTSLAGLGEADSAGGVPARVIVGLGTCHRLHRQ